MIQKPASIVIEPMLATLGAVPAADAASWAVEGKWDGTRVLAFISGDSVRLQSRNGKDLTAAYPELSALASAIGSRDAILDGEVVMLDVLARPDFEALQSRMHLSSPAQIARLARIRPVHYVAFDVISINGEMLTGRPYSSRRDALESLVTAGRVMGMPLRVVSVPPAFPGTDFAALLASTRSNGLEGVVSKRLDSLYEPGVRSPSWRKVKNLLRQEVVVAGWKPGQGNREKLGSLIAGVYEGDDLVYCGHVGTGFTDEIITLLAGKLRGLSRDTSPLREVPREHARDSCWTEPALVVEVSFERWTRTGRMRWPAYKGLRDDKDPHSVVAELTATEI